MNKHKIVALLPMKANSERVKGKNFREFCGKPLFRWILDTLLEVKEIDKIIINTDARGILQQHGLFDSDHVVIRDRPVDLCGDSVSMNRVIADDVSNCKADVFLMTHTTNPLLSADTIRKSLTAFHQAEKNGNTDSLFTVNKVQTRFYRADCSAVNHDPQKLIPTQELESWYEENSNLYIFTDSSFKSTKSRIGLHPIMYESPPIESIDIDTMDDWDIATIAASFLSEKKATR